VERSVRVLLASSNAGKLREYREMADGSAVELELIPDFSRLPAFEESAPTFAENAAGKALHYSRFSNEIVLADDSGLVVPALEGAPGVQSARYAGGDATDSDRVQKLLSEMRGKTGDDRRAKFVCVTALALRGRALAVVSDSAEGILADGPRGTNGFGYDPIFLYTELGKTFAEISRQEKNRLSHRGKAFQKIMRLLAAPNHLT
jgi:XTP/dITP diphosphohydrolase